MLVHMAEAELGLNIDRNRIIELIYQYPGVVSAIINSYSKLEITIRDKEFSEELMESVLIFLVRSGVTSFRSWSVSDF